MVMQSWWRKVLVVEMVDEEGGSLVVMDVKE